MINITLVENESKPFQKAMEDEMAKAIKHLEIELVKVRTGRAHTALIEDLPVSVYGGAPMPLKQVAACAAPDARLLTIQPWDPSVIGEIEKAISNLKYSGSPNKNSQKDNYSDELSSCLGTVKTPQYNKNKLE